DFAGEPILQIGKNTAHNVTLYAKWIIRENTLTMRRRLMPWDNGKFIDYTFKFTIESEDIVYNKLEIEGKKEWERIATFDNFEDRISGKNELYSLSCSKTPGDKIVIFDFIEIEYHFVLHTNGGILDNWTNTITYIHMFGYDKLSVFLPVRGDDIFVGWYENEELTGEPLTTIAPCSRYGNVELWAKYETLGNFVLQIGKAPMIYPFANFKNEVGAICFAGKNIGLKGYCTQNVKHDEQNSVELDRYYSFYKLAGWSFTKTDMLDWGNDTNFSKTVALVDINTLKQTEERIVLYAVFDFYSTASKSKGEKEGYKQGAIMTNAPFEIPEPDIIDKGNEFGDNVKNGFDWFKDKITSGWKWFADEMQQVFGDTFAWKNFFTKDFWSFKNVKVYIVAAGALFIIWFLAKIFKK
ncbi:MAG: hypothetical protein RR416_06385, partial [Clostridia bacterium]